MTNKQQRFIQEYLKCLNATEAARRAGYSPKTANVTGSQYLAKPSIQRAIKVAMDERAKRAEIDADYVITRIQEIAERADASDRDQLRALELLGKHLGLFTDKADPGGSEMSVALRIVKHYDGNDPRLLDSGPDSNKT